MKVDDFIILVSKMLYNVFGIITEEDHIYYGIKPDEPFDDEEWIVNVCSLLYVQYFPNGEPHKKFVLSAIEPIPGNRFEPPSEDVKELGSYESHNHTLRAICMIMVAERYNAWEESLEDA